MSDRFKGCTVVFDREIHEEDVEAVLNAIRMVKGVQIVKPSLSTHNDWMAATKARSDLIDKLYAWLTEERKKWK